MGSHITNGTQRFDLVKPCAQCPFLRDGSGIRFRCRSRAEEIEESAYRNGFVCHKHAEHVDDGDDGDDGCGGFDFSGAGTSQHCFGALAMYLNTGCESVPFAWLDESQKNAWWQRATDDGMAACYCGESEFLDSYGESDNGQ